MRQQQNKFHNVGRTNSILCINMSMDKYVYQIQGALESAEGKFKGFRVLVCDLYNFDSVDVPVEVLDKETAGFIQFRLRCTQSAINIANLPHGVKNRIRAPLGRWLDRWVRENFHGIISEPKSTNS